jgi:hypothetical protein
MTSGEFIPFSGGGRNVTRTPCYWNIPDEYSVLLISE